jgi:drug/metabolite transporter (DMT)-like permease
MTQSTQGKGRSPIDPDATLGLAWAFVATSLFAMMSILARLAGESVSWSQVATSRGVVGAMVAFAVARHSRSSLKVDNQPLAWCRSLIGTVAMLFTFYTLTAKSISLGDVSTLRATAPLFVAILSVLTLRERIDRRVGFAALLGFSGVLVLVQPSFAISGRLAILALAGAFFSAVAMIFLRRLGPNESPEAVAFHFSMVSSVALVLITGSDWSLPSYRGLSFLLLTGLTGGMAQLAITRAYSRSKATPVALVGYLGIAMTQGLSVLVLGETLGAHQIIGAILVTSSGGLLMVGQMLDRRSQRGA